MTVSIYADTETTSVWHAGEFVPDDGQHTGPKFIWKPLNYWQVQKVFAAKDDNAEQVRVVLTHGLLWVDGDQEKAKEFVAQPSYVVANALFNLIWNASMGN